MVYVKKRKRYYIETNFDFHMKKLKKKKNNCSINNKSKMMIRLLNKTRIKSCKNKLLILLLLAITWFKFFITIAICKSSSSSMISNDILFSANRVFTNENNNNRFLNEFQSMKFIGQQNNNNDQPANNEKPFGKFFSFLFAVYNYHIELRLFLSNYILQRDRRRLFLFSVVVFIINFHVPKNNNLLIAPKWIYCFFLSMCLLKYPPDIQLAVLLLALVVV